MSELTATCDKPAMRKRGRPVQMQTAERESLVLTCAIELLSERGPEDVTMTDIAARAGMSKRTLYALYRSREELLGAGLKRFCKTLFRPLHPSEQNASLKDRLRILLTFDPDAEIGTVPFEMLRIVIASARTYPDMARDLAEQGPGQVIDLLCAELEKAAKTGEIDLPAKDIRTTAELLVDMVVGDLIPCLLDPARVRIMPEERAVRRDRAIEIFLNGVRPRPA